MSSFFFLKPFLPNHAGFKQDYVSWDRLDYLKTSGIRILVVAGAQDRIVASANSQMLHSALGGELFWAPDAGHCVNEQYAEGVNKAMSKTWREAETAPERKNAIAPFSPGHHPYLLAGIVIALRSVLLRAAGRRVTPSSASVVNTATLTALLYIAKRFAGGFQPNIWFL